MQIRAKVRQGQDEGGIGSSEKHHSVFKSNYSIQSSCNEIPVTVAYPGHTRKGNHLNSRWNDHMFRAFDLLSINKVIVTGWVHDPPNLKRSIGCVMSNGDSLTFKVKTSKDELSL